MLKYISFYVILSLWFPGIRLSKVADNKTYDDPGYYSQVFIWPENTEGIYPDIKELIRTEGKRFYNIHNPGLTIYEPKTANGVAIILCPGGGYEYVASGIEGGPVAEILIKSGITVFVLKYRLPNTPGVNYKHPVPLSDAIRAVQFVRFNAAKYRIDPDKIGIMGFSAGGHLASMAGTLFDKYKFGNDEISKISARPDFMCLVYPVISTEKSIMHTCIKSLTDSAGKQNLQDFSSELNVSAETPPAFLVHAKDDESVPFQNSVVMYEALSRLGISAELKLYLKGGHGFGVGRPGTDSINWINDFLSWLSKLKL